MLRTFIFAVLLGVSGAVYAREVVTEVEVYFLEGSDKMSLWTADNHIEIARLYNALSDARNTPGAEILSIVLTSSTAFDSNQERLSGLADNRANALKSIITNYMELPVGIITYNTNPQYQWKWLQKAVKNSSLEEKGEIMAVLNLPEDLIEYKDGNVRDRRINKLMLMNSGTTWENMRKEIFPGMRHAHATITVLYNNHSIEDSPDNILP